MRSAHLCGSLNALLTRAPGMYLPWVLCGFELLLGGVPLQYFAGIFVAHVFFFLTEVAPQMGWPALRTPQVSAFTQCFTT